MPAWALGVGAFEIEIFFKTKSGNKEAREATEPF